MDYNWRFPAVEMVEETLKGPENLGVGSLEFNKIARDVSGGSCGGWRDDD